MKKLLVILGSVLLVLAMASAGLCAYHHEGERDAEKFLSAYPAKTGTKLDHCALCHSGGEYESKGNMVALGSCQWCHYTYGYDASGNILDTLNPYGKAYHDNGRSTAAIQNIENLDSDGDGYINIVEIQANRYPGDANDDPSKILAPYRVYTKAQLEAMGQHTQFLLMNTSRSGDYYAEYTGIVLEDLLNDAGMLPSATGIIVYSPDGWSQYHPLDQDPDPELYYVRGVYPSSVYYYDVQADQAENPVDGWCDYSAPSCKGRNPLDAISVEGGLKTILAYKREGSPMDPGILNEDNKLDGEGPFRVVPPQKNPTPPDQSSKSENQDVIWPYDFDWDHNAGASTRTVTIIKVEPMPAGTTDIDLLEAGWAYVDQEKIVIYGGIDGTDSNGNGILDSEEGTDASSDFNGNGIPDYQDPRTARLRQANGADFILLDTSNGAFIEVEALNHDDPSVCQTSKPDMDFPCGATRFTITGLAPGESVTVSLVMPEDVPTSAKYYKISATDGWQEIPFGSNDGDNIITITVTDGDPLTDADGVENGTIVDPGAIATSDAPPVSGGGGGGGGCFITTLRDGLNFGTAQAILLGLIIAALLVMFRKREDS